MHEREKSASKETKATPFASSRGQGPVPVSNAKSGRSLFSGLLGRSSSTATPPAPPPPPVAAPVQPPPPPAPAPAPVHQKTSSLDLTDPELQGVLAELRQMGITEAQIKDNEGFIRSYIQNQATEAAPKTSPSIEEDQRKVKAPPPPPPAVAPQPKITSISPQSTGGSSGKRGPPPPPPSRRRVDVSPAAQEPETPAPPPPREPSPPRLRFRAPPPIADAGKFAEPVTAPGRPRASSNVTAGAHAPPRPPKTPMDEAPSPPPVPRSHGVAPPFQGERKVSAPPAPPTRTSPGHAPPPPPRETTPQLPPKIPHTNAASPIPPPPPARGPAPPLPPPNARPVPPPPPPPSVPQTLPPRIPPSPTSGVPSPPPPPPPPPPPGGHPTVAPPPPPPPPPPSGPPGAPPPPPPAPGCGGAGPPPPPPPAGVAPPHLPSSGGGGRDDLLAAIRGQGSGGLRKVNAAEKRDRSAAMVPGGTSDTPAASTPSAAPGGSLADALRGALDKRKQVVSGSGMCKRSFYEMIVLIKLQTMKKKTMITGIRVISHWTMHRTWKIHDKQLRAYASSLDRA
jgi:neural Wiskott-Aldrich syndrome protein